MAKRVKRGLEPLHIGLMPDPEPVIAERVAEEYKRLCSLTDAMHIPKGPARWYLLALELARQHVPELKEEKPLGAPTKWSTSHLIALGGELSRLTDQNKTKAAAAEELAKSEPWESFIGEKKGTFGHTPGEALLKQCDRNPEWCHMGADIRRAYEEHGQPNDWREFLAAIFKK